MNDKEIADLITQETLQKTKKYHEIGVKAFSNDSDEKPKSKPNVQFLKNLVKQTTPRESSRESREKYGPPKPPHLS